MAFIVEDGSGIPEATAYATEAFVDGYHNDRGNTTWTGLTQALKQRYIIEASDYIDRRFGSSFLGCRRFPSVLQARGTITFTQQPTNGQTVTINGVVYTFGTGVTIGSRLGQTVANLITTINAAMATTEIGANQLGTRAFYIQPSYNGEDGNDIAVSTNVTGASWNNATLRGGNGFGRPQGLEFPRRYVYYPGSSQEIVDIPEKVREACAEYADRARIAATTGGLMPDPTRDATGAQVTRLKEQVGPIVEEKEFQSGLTQRIPSYPEADRLLWDFLIGHGQGGTSR